MTKTADVTVRAIASGGSGVADLPDGRVVFIPRTAPGDVARVSIQKSRPRWAVGSLERLLEAGPDRSEPACSIYAKCGGCQLQHLPYEHQLQWKSRFVSDALARIGGLDGVEVGAVEPSPETTRYRSRVTFTLRRLKGGYTVAGFHALGRPAHVIDVHNECLLPETALNEAWQRLRAAWGTGASELPAGGRLQLTLRMAEPGIELHVDGGADAWNATDSFASAAGLSGIWHTPHDSEADPELVYGITGTGGGFGFEQVNREAAVAVRAHVFDVVGDPGPEGARLVDAYAGAGAYGRHFATLGWSVEMIEVDGSLIEASSGEDGVAATVGKVEDRLEASLPADRLVLNPPRGGLDASIPPMILATPPAQVVYVSCDPATLARDLRVLAPGFQIESVRAFDIFPQTAHVEAVVVLSRRSDKEPSS